MRIRLELNFCIEGSDSSVDSIGRPLLLLVEVERLGNLRAACQAIGVSYRSGWDLIAVLEERLGAPVLEMTRGRGSELTELGRRLLWAQKLVHARFDPLLDSMAVEIDAQVQRTLAHGPEYLKIFASHGYAVAALNTYLQRTHASVELSYRGSLEALSALNHKTCHVAGFHIPIGELGPQVLARIRPLIRDSYRIITIASRRQGFMVRKGNPKGIWNLDDLFKPEVSFVNRQQGSGTRLLLELLLQRANLDGSQVHGFGNVELTHAAVAAYVASGKADVGLGVEAAARQFDLDFVPVLSERYMFACEESLLSDARLAGLLSYVQGPQFRAELLNYPGYEGHEAGKVLHPAEAFAI